MRFLAAVLTFSFLLMSAPVRAEPCDPDDAPCITRKALEFKYRADALQEENDILRNELAEERNRADSAPKLFLFGGVVFVAFFGGFFAAYKALK